MTSRQKLIKRLDDLTREQVKKRDKNTCQYSGRSIADGHTIIDWSHIIPRGVGSLLLRWHTANSLCLTREWHNYLDKNPVVKDTWFKKKFPARYKLITELDQQPKKTIHNSDLAELLELKKQENKPIYSLAAKEDG
jgi:5-methylcytosine-specific restriction endonuclease McrA